MPTLIIGGTGKTGSRVAHRLDALGHANRPVSRSTDPRFDWTDPGSWPAALAGCDAAYVTYQPDLAIPGADEAIGRFAAAAVAAGCRRLVLLSGRGEEGAQRAEQALIASGAEWTIIRSAFFAQNFTESIWAPEVAAGRLTMLRHGAPEPFVDADDIADVAVAALTAPGHVGRVHNVTGPRLLTFGDVADAIGAAAGRPVTYVELGTDDFIGHLVDAGVPREDAAGMAHLFSEVLDGRNAHVTTDVADVLGREPRDLADVIART
ncbi:uncharacterized protein YbjT (DUF2867 family) [Murinocardiopsis flavida]|uniref:Uncharacterized protein YbjT (DUF2867 family) n=1 Tax=Murinocardiopsis flavida TaxID=645275 RepID=A0A2P8CR95_9ACTN|nr:NAD(P)H-binding protein [Murinocardiopsis flavida]PSK87484.1 uncharacterized protein YbjT (DUF2867 family) [Murinocardiopsis flavida]